MDTLLPIIIRSIKGDNGSYYFPLLTSPTCRCRGVNESMKLPEPDTTTATLVDISGGTRPSATAVFRRSCRWTRGTRKIGPTFSPRQPPLLAAESPPQHFCFWTAGTCAEPSLMCLCLRRVDYIAGKGRLGSYVPVGKKKEECSQRNWQEGHRPLLRQLDITLRVQ